jgi:acetyl esterase
VWLSRKAPVTVDGLTLAPDLQLLLALRVARGAPVLRKLGAAAARKRLRRDALIHAGETIPVRSVRDLEIAPGLRARHYAPDSQGEAPLIVFFHGGGFVVCDLDTHDPACRVLCRDAAAHVLAVDYRLAPEAPFPAAVEDAQAALAWAQAHARELGADPARIAVAGDSAGGNLATVVCQLAKRNGAPAPAAQLLLYPAVDRSTVRPSLELFRDGFFLTRDDVDWYFENYVAGVQVDPGDPRLSPLRCPDLSGLPPALVVTAGFDPLRDEGEAYARALRDAGNVVVLRRFDSLIHGFANMIGLSRSCREAMTEVARSLRALLPKGAEA